MIYWARLVPASLLGSVAVASASVAQAQRLGQGSNPEVSFVRLVAALVVCLVVALLAILLIRTRRSGAALPQFLSRLKTLGTAVEIIETRRISVHADVCLLRYGGREYLLLISHGHSRILADRTTSESGATGA